ncbi:tetratricopeptide repeat protein [Erythrobacter gaetbuli]|uniref:Tetratricopeptide repeat protein n=1 Tax=Qipengyuania gaetbuli TaxID=266952 RepID=A0A844XYM3_9SPHN|nr:tetratricopeptide repeat protein [Qipengyuania gaetbuli]MXO51095.1 tetratricopeptide repeat protein [Qipengyuania gaetbuli]
MARTPKTDLTREEKKARADAAEQEALLREVDDAVRQGDFESFATSYGKPLLGVLIAGLAAFGGYLWWDNQNEQKMEAQSEALVVALDQLEAGNNAAALEKLNSMEGEGTAVISAKLLRAGLASEAGNDAEAVKLFGEVADDESAPKVMRDMALLRRVTLQYDDLEPAEVIAALKPLATPGEPLFASAGEIVAHAYLAQGKRAEAGALFGQIARAEGTPEGTRSRVLNMAGILGVDAVDDVEKLLDSQRIDPQAEAQQPAAE